MRLAILFKSVLATFLCMQDTVFISASLPSGSQCDVSVQKMGCFMDDLPRKSRPLPELLLTDRDPLSSQFSGKLLNWTIWNQYINDLVCRCAKKTRQRNYKYFGIQYYGECWSGPNDTYARTRKSLRCVGQNYSSCNVTSPSYCVGRDRDNFVYRVEETNKFQKVGCICTKIDSQLPHSYRMFDYTQKIDWNNMGKFLKTFPTDCQTKATQKGYSYYALQSYGQCWSGPGDLQSLSGQLRSSCCNVGINDCTDDDAVCLGGPNSAFVFKRQ